MFCGSNLCWWCFVVKSIGCFRSGLIKFLFFFRSEGTKIGSALSGASVSALLGLAASSLGIISFESPAYSILLEFLFPLTIPLLLFRAYLRRVFTSTAIFLLAFLIGTGISQMFFLVWESVKNLLGLILKWKFVCGFSMLSD